MEEIIHNLTKEDHKNSNINNSNNNSKDSSSNNNINNRDKIEVKDFMRITWEKLKELQ
jgi:hypothetical protein